MAHTPGPWTVHAYNRELFMVDYFTPGKCADGIDDIGNRTVETTEENRRLIAAAPELLEALENLIQYSDFHTGEVCSDSGLGAYIRAQAAIAKATGKAVQNGN